MRPQDGRITPPHHGPAAGHADKPGCLWIKKSLSTSFSPGFPASLRPRLSLWKKQEVFHNRPAAFRSAAPARKLIFRGCGLSGSIRRGNVDKGGFPRDLIVFQGIKRYNDVGYAHFHIPYIIRLRFDTQISIASLFYFSLRMTGSHFFKARKHITI